MERWLKLDATWPHGRTAKRIVDQFGRDGLLVWVCLLTAAKRNVPEGQVVVVGEGWIELGLVPAPPFSFSLAEFLRLTGQLHLTSRRRSGEVTTINLRSWHDWQTKWRRDSDRERKSCNKRESKAETLRKENGNALAEKRTEREIEIEIEKTPVVPFAGDGRVDEVYDHWRSARSKTDPRYKRLSDNRRSKIRARLREFSADELKRAIDAVALDPWEDRPRHDDIPTIFRNEEQVQKFLALFDDPAVLDEKERLRRHFQSLENGDAG